MARVCRAPLHGVTGGSESGRAPRLFELERKLEQCYGRLEDAGGKGRFNRQRDRCGRKMIAALMACMIARRFVRFVGLVLRRAVVVVPGVVVRGCGGGMPFVRGARERVHHRRHSVKRKDQEERQRIDRCRRADMEAKCKDDRTSNQVEDPSGAW